MSHSGTPAGYDKGWEDGYDQARRETRKRYQPLVKAAQALLKRWATNKNMSEQAQALAEALKGTPK